MTNKQIANELRRHALYDSNGYIGSLPSDAAFDVAREFLPHGAVWGFSLVDEINRRMFLIFIAESLE